MPLIPVQAVVSILSEATSFFTYSEILDYYMSAPKPQTLKQSKFLLLSVLSELEENRHICSYLGPALTMFKLLHNETQGILVVNPQMLKYCNNPETIRVVHNILERLVCMIPLQRKNQMAMTQIVKSIDSIQFEMTVKVLLNILYTLTRELSTADLDAYNREKDMEQILLKLIQCSLEYQFVPIKKVIIFYYWIITTKFKDMVQIDELKLSQIADNVVTEEELQKSLSESPRLLSPHTNAVESFFAKHNINDCILAQTIVVGLLRALLNSCNSKPVVSTNGVDVYKQWRASYVYANTREEKLPQNLKQLLRDYREWESLNMGEKVQEGDNNKSVIQEESDRHRMYTAWAITSFFGYLLVSFKQNTFLQYTYFIQLISDANGVLVLLKFLTDKFTFNEIAPLELYTRNSRFAENFKKAIYTVLILLEATCKNSSDRIRNFLLVYNGFLIFKKIPALVGEDPVVSSLVHTLLRIQLPYLSKKSKESTSNTKMITDIYCKYPSKTGLPQPLTNYQRLRLKNRMKPKHAKELVSPDDIKNAHLQFNNHHYWHVEGQQHIAPTHKVDLMDKLEREVKLPENFDHKKWLQDNVWGYYD